MNSLKKQIKELIEHNKELIGQTKELKNKNDETTQKLNQLIKKTNIFEALSKLNDCAALSNNTFKKKYREWFELGKYDNNIPNLGQFVDNPPDEDSYSEQYEFWKDFCTKYPNSDNKGFKMIYGE